MESRHAGKVVAEFHLAAQVEMLGAEVVPELGLGKHDGVAAFAPDIEEARETQARRTEEVLAAPDRGELERDLTGKVHELFEQQLENLYKAYSMQDQNGNRVIDEQQLMLGVASIAGDMATAFEQALPIAEQLGQTIADAFSYQGYDVVGDGSGSSSSSKSIQNVTESTADLLASYLNAIRADTSVNRVTLSQILIAVQTQAEMPVIARAQLQQLQVIAGNTGRNVEIVDSIYNLLHSIAPDGIAWSIK